METGAVADVLRKQKPVCDSAVKSGPTPVRRLEAPLKLASDIIVDTTRCRDGKTHLGNNISLSFLELESIQHGQ